MSRVLCLCLALLSLGCPPPRPAGPAAEEVPEAVRALVRQAALDKEASTEHQFHRWEGRTITEADATRAGNPALFRPGTLMVRVVYRGKDARGVWRTYDEMAVVFEGRVGEGGLVANVRGDDWRRDLEAGPP